jgi:glycerol-3-phosphate dehydrogenase
MPAARGSATSSRTSRGRTRPTKVRLVRGSHIVTRKLYDHDKCYFFQGTDGRIIFAIPYETDFTLIGTTDQEHRRRAQTAGLHARGTRLPAALRQPVFQEPLTVEDVVWTYSGVRPLYDDGASSATAATRDYVLSLEDAGRAAAERVRRQDHHLSPPRRSALAKLAPFFPGPGKAWTAGVPLPGGISRWTGSTARRPDLRADYPSCPTRWARRLVRAYGTEARAILGDAAKVAADLGRDFGATLTEAEVRWLMTQGIRAHRGGRVWRRSKLGLRLTGPDRRGSTPSCRARARAGGGVACPTRTDAVALRGGLGKGRRPRHDTDSGHRSGHHIDTGHRLRRRDDAGRHPRRRNSRRSIPLPAGSNMTRR